VSTEHQGRCNSPRTSTKTHNVREWFRVAFECSDSVLAPASLAEQERKMISERTRARLADAQAKGVQLGKIGPIPKAGCHAQVD
jgi:hypothetical protein